MSKKHWNKSKTIKFWEDEDDENIIYMAGDSLKEVFPDSCGVIKNYIPKQWRELSIYQPSGDFFKAIHEEIMKRADLYDKGQYKKTKSNLDEIEDIIKTAGDKIKKNNER